MKILKLVILSMCLGVSLSLRKEIRMVVDVIKSYEKPTAVVANVCWRLSEKNNLMSQLMRSKKAFTVLFITDRKEIEKFNPIDTIIVTDINCHDSARFLKQANDNNMFSESFRWFIMEKPNEFGNISTELLTNLNILVNSEVIVAVKTENGTFKLNLIYRIDTSSKFLTEEFGIWNASDGFQVSEVVSKTTITMRRKDLSGKTITASCVITQNKTRTQIHESRDLKTDNIAKATYHNILPLYEFMNATKALLFTDTWGYQDNTNKSWNGMMGDIVNGKAELCGTISFISEKRVPLIQYITQPIPIIPKFVFREPPLSFQNNLFILPFRETVWMCIGGLVLILIMILYINAKWEKVKDEEMVPNDSRILEPDVSDIGILVISAITQQGSTNELKGSLGRVVTFLMFLIFLFLYTSYSANIIALLQSSSSQIRTLTDLLNSKLELGVQDEKYNRYYFPAATEPVRKAIYETKITNVGHKPNFMSIEEGVRRLQNKDAPFGFVMNLGIGYKIVEELFHEHEKCGLQEIAYYPNNIPWLCSKKASPYKEIYKVGLSRTLEHGLGDRVSRIFYVRKPVCNVRGGSFASVNMVDFHPVLLWMVYGMSLSVILLVVELLLHRRQRYTQKE